MKKFLRIIGKSSVIRQKGESQNGRFKKTKQAKTFRKTNISYPLIRTQTMKYPWRATLWKVGSITGALWKFLKFSWKKPTVIYDTQYFRYIKTSLVHCIQYWNSLPRQKYLRKNLKYLFHSCKESID